MDIIITTRPSVGNMVILCLFQSVDGTETSHDPLVMTQSLCNMIYVAFWQWRRRHICPLRIRHPWFGHCTNLTSSCNNLSIHTSSTTLRSFKTSHAHARIDKKCCRVPSTHLFSTLWLLTRSRWAQVIVSFMCESLFVILHARTNFSHS